MTENPRVMSWAWTPLQKFVMPPVTVGVVIWLTTILLSPAAAQAPMFIKAVAVAFMAAFLWIGWMFAGLKYVALIGDALRVSNYRRDILVPLRDVVRVKQTTARGWRWGDTTVIIAIDLAGDTDFGKRIKFMTPPTSYAFGSPNPIVEELSEAVKAAKRADLGL